MAKAKPLKVLPKTIRKARFFLQRKGLRTSDMSPRAFAEAAAETGKSFSDLLKTIAVLQLGGQGQGQAPQAAKLAASEAGR